MMTIIKASKRPKSSPSPDQSSAHLAGGSDGSGGPHGPEPGAEGSGHGLHQGSQPEPEPPPPEPPPLFWSAETVASGEVPDRRQRPDYPDRRSGHRRAEDQHLISVAHEEAQHIYAVAHQQGYEAGLAQAQEVIEQLGEALERLAAVEQEALLQMVQQVIPIAVTIAEKVIHTEVSADPDLVVALAKDLLKRADPAQKQIVFRLHPVDGEVIQAALDEDPTWTFNGRQVLIMPDESMEMGGVIVETPAGMMDGSIPTQLAVVRRLLGIAPA
jgi:flagellar assembly protein FliH